MVVATVGVVAVDCAVALTVAVVAIVFFVLVLLVVVGCDGLSGGFDTVVVLALRAVVVSVVCG